MVCVCMSGAGSELWASWGSGRAEENKGWTMTEDMWTTLMSNQASALSMVA